LDIEIVKKIIIECSPGKPHYELFGGEPLLYPYFEEVMKTIRHYGSTVDIPTNGTLLEENAEMLVTLGLRNVFVSLDGPESINDSQRGRGVYQKAVRGMKKLFEVRAKKGTDLPKIGIGTIVTPFNYTYLERFFTECIDLSIINHVSIELQSFISQQNY
jgi:MoaA/NifB/PqqE/SkfB family radical SAM enzyme